MKQFFITLFSGFPYFGQSLALRDHDLVPIDFCSASHTATYEDGVTMPCENAYDGNQGTRWSSDPLAGWSSTPTSGSWIELNFPGTYMVVAVEINWEYAYARLFNLQLFDGALMTSGQQYSADSSTASQNSFQTLTFGDGGVPANKMRVTSIQDSGSAGMSIWELEVYTNGPPLPPPEANVPEANDDPHCTNLRGEHFDIFVTGNRTLLKVPNSPSKKNVTLEVQAFIAHASRTKCAETFMTNISMRGKLAHGVIEVATGPSGHPIVVNEITANLTSLRNDTLSVLLAGVTINIRQRHGILWDFDYLNLNISGLTKTFKDNVGGPLGYGDHSYLSHATDACKDWSQKHARNKRNNAKTLIGVNSNSTRFLSTIMVY